MAQLNLTLYQEEILQILAKDRNEAFARILQSSLKSVLKAESAERFGTHPYERIRPNITHKIIRDTAPKL